MTFETCDACGDKLAILPQGGATSRRAFLKSGAGLIAGGATARVMPFGRGLWHRETFTGGADAELTALPKGSVAFSSRAAWCSHLDRQVGVLPQGGRADRGWQNSRGPAEHRDIGRRG